jgi:ABC-type Na+ efflux pump permease subunit
MTKWQVLLIKEIKHLFRDTKTIVQTVVVPTFITPLLLGAIFWYVGSIATEETKKTYDISTYTSTESNLITQLNDSDRLNVLTEASIDEVITSVTDGVTEIGLVLDNSFLNDLESDSSAKITIYSKNIDTFSQAKSLVTNIIDDFEEEERNERLVALNLTNEYVNPILIEEEDLTTEQESAGSIFGAILALFFVMYVMSGSTYPSG